MKTCYQFIGLVILAGGMFTEAFAWQKEALENVNVPGISLADQKYELTAGLFGNSQKGLRRNEYFIRQSGQSSTYAAQNIRQQLGFMFTPHGYQVKNFTDYNERPWQAHFRFKGISRSGKPLHTPSLVDLNNEDNLLEYDYADFTIQYFNDKRGMRQNFIVKRPLPDKGNIEVAIHLTGDLHPKMKNNGKLIMYEGRTAQLYYDDIIVWDADDRLLDAWMELRGTNELVISINDDFARYPITIDPLNHSPRMADLDSLEFGQEPQIMLPGQGQDISKIQTASENEKDVITSPVSWSPDRAPGLLAAIAIQYPLTGWEQKRPLKRIQNRYYPSKRKRLPASHIG